MSRLYILIALTLFCLDLVQNAVDARPFHHHRPHRPHHHRGSNRIVAVGDLHSDYNNTLNVLQMAKIIDRRGNWIAGRDTFIQTGDNVDRGNGTIAIYQLLQKLRKQAKRAGGEVVNLLGNHEVMNLQGDLRYVTEDEIATFGSPEARKAAWDMQTGWLGSFVHNSFNISHIQNGHTMFSHADMSVEWATKGVDQMNVMAHQALTEKLFKEPIFKTYGPVWNRDLAKQTAGEKETCEIIDNITKILGVSRMVSGHTAQSKSGKVLSLCNGGYIGIDVGITAYYGGNLAALEIIENRNGTQTVSAIYPTGKVILS
ncbi:MAG: Metallo-dependent phosphatase-like protein [Linnemannia elongata]|nr:MAG: Metallo-dependent phosphatase-like protein [Linnemannia elongata]